MNSREHLTRGSIWHRWDPHIHAPGTVLNNQYPKRQAWEKYLKKLKTAVPPIRAIGVTDYYLLDTYETVVKAKADGFLSNVEFIFPNVELRLAISTDHSRPINLHLLIDPNDTDHVAKVKRFLELLTFRYNNQEYTCNNDGFIALGKAHDSRCKSKKKMFEVGVRQFKVEFSQFLKRWEANEWIRQNALIAVATGRGDGTSGLQMDSSLAALRQNIEATAHIMFGSSPNERAFWLGEKDGAPPKDIIQRYNALKPCLHGSDAHALERVGMPDQKRYSWIKGDLSFDTLRQICMEPKDRVIVAESPPTGPVDSSVIESVEVLNASWFATGKLPLNSGLVGIIGARGSGKTALADMIAAGTHSLSSRVNPRSFVHRAKEYIDDETAVHVRWKDGQISQSKIEHDEVDKCLDHPRVQYLSQEFVETLCSESGASDELVAEIKELIFLAHPAEDRQDTGTFQDLLDTKAALGRQQRKTHERNISEINEEIACEFDKIDNLDLWKARVHELKQTIRSDKKSKGELITICQISKATAFEKVTNAVASQRQYIAQLNRQKDAVKLLQHNVRKHRETIAGSMMRHLVREHRDANLSDSEWELFMTDFVGDVDTLLMEKLAEIEVKISRNTGTMPQEDDSGTENSRPSDTSLLANGVALNKIPLRVLEAEEQRLSLLVEANNHRRIQFARLTEKIAKAKAQLGNLTREIQGVGEAGARIKDLVDERNNDYYEVFNGILAEEDALRSLYGPLDAQLKLFDGAVRSLAVSIKRNVDVVEWVTRGEELLDLRRGDRFRGRGALLSTADKYLRSAWETGNAADASGAMKAFLTAHRNDVLKGTPYDQKTQHGEYRAWCRRISDWLYSTDHISVTYSLTFEGVEIERLSPGTRGIVLLLLYLAIDRDNDRPLIIDQPEENLDPESIFEELVPRFRRAKLHRQIIIVTHNANLIVNADADQVIVASCGPHDPGKLPNISYESGSLEDPHIRAKVCNILEGGEQAFRDRSKRLRVKF